MSQRVHPGHNLGLHSYCIGITAAEAAAQALLEEYDADGYRYGVRNGDTIIEGWKGPAQRRQACRQLASMRQTWPRSEFVLIRHLPDQDWELDPDDVGRKKRQR